MNLRKCICILTAAVLLLAGTGLFAGRAAAETAETTEEKKPLTYEHDPRDNPVAMRDAVYNPDAVYGFSPTPESSRTGAFADAIDWGNEEQVAAARAERQVYHDSMRELYVLVMDMLEMGERVEVIARTVSKRRNELAVFAGSFSMLLFKEIRWKPFEQWEPYDNYAKTYSEVSNNPPHKMAKNMRHILDFFQTITGNNP